jgi:hypothetical protein
MVFLVPGACTGARQSALLSPIRTTTKNFTGILSISFPPEATTSGTTGSVRSRGERGGFPSIAARSRVRREHCEQRGCGWARPGVRGCSSDLDGILLVVLPHAASTARPLHCRVLTPDVNPRRFRAPEGQLTRPNPDCSECCFVYYYLPSIESEFIADQAGIVSFYTGMRKHRRFDYSSVCLGSRAICVLMNSRSLVCGVFGTLIRDRSRAGGSSPVTPSLGSATAKRSRDPSGPRRPTIPLGISTATAVLTL